MPVDQKVWLWRNFSSDEDSNWGESVEGNFGEFLQTGLGSDESGVKRIPNACPMESIAWCPGGDFRKIL